MSHNDSYPTGPSVADDLMRLIEQRKSTQIGEWEFEASKRRILKLPPSGFNPLVRNLLGCLIINCIILGLVIAFPEYVRITVPVIGIVIAYLIFAGGYFLNEITELGRVRRSGPGAVDRQLGLDRMFGDKPNLVRLFRNLKGKGRS